MFFELSIVLILLESILMATTLLLTDVEELHIIYINGTC